MHTARQIYEQAPLGSLIAFRSGTPRPPERFTRKVKAWEQENGTGRLVERQAGFGRSPATFTLHLGDFGSEGVIIMVIRRLFSAESAKPFEILEKPKAGMVRVLTGHGERQELRFLANDMAQAERWMAEHHYSGIRAEIVPDSDPVVLPGATARAA
ncbi:hypothetical protein SAMN06295912_11288 [Sphingomonas laterariae]|uniref:Uncharacterized protein n=1 Tax=Edaphosphingomonas laterariae TaxID=861865 RepID=A0A239GIY7_9SPHN|nr:hypothetical protein [Sphingomonas laterariae]SNS68855.1 hypothetical protein SAMN06295912_11288 [Sphingomonas laterariae]